MRTKFASHQLTKLVVEIGGECPSPAKATGVGDRTVSLIASTESNGRIVLWIAVDYLGADGALLERLAMAAYDIDRHTSALHDAVALADYWGMPVRGATASDGWVTANRDWDPLL